MKTAAYYLEKLAESRVPEHMHDGYLRYLLHGIPMGSFGNAVLSNDLREACARADRFNRHTLCEHVDFLYNYAPADCWGSPAAVNAWVNRHARARAAAQEEMTK